MQPEKKIVLNLVLLLVGVTAVYWVVSNRNPREDKN
jgi:hypothetical protein